MAKDPVLVVLQLSGGNDYMNTVIPYANSLYWDNRPIVNIPEDKIVDLDGKVGFNPSMAPLKKFYEDGRLALIHGVGYADSPGSPDPGHGCLRHARAHVHLQRARRRDG